MCLNLIHLEIPILEDDADLDDILAVLAEPQLRTFQSKRGLTEDDGLLHQPRILARLSPHLTQLAITVHAEDFTTSPEYTMFTHLRHVHIRGVVWTKGWETLSDSNRDDRG